MATILIKTKLTGPIDPADIEYREIVFGDTEKCLFVKDTVSTLKTVPTIDDTGTSAYSVFSSSYVDTLVGNIDNTPDLDKPISTATQTVLDDKLDKVTINDTSTLTTKIWSASKLTSEFSNVSVIDDGTIANDALWSSDKINTEITALPSINDASILSTDIWSAEKINTELGSLPAINDAGSTVNDLWSANKINTELLSVEAGIPEINDSTESTSTLWSSTKINTELNALPSINDSSTLASDLWSASNINSKIESLPDINDVGTGTTDLWSASKISSELDGAGGFPSGTVLIFGQSFAPTGWTKKTDWANNSMLTINTLADGTALGYGGSYNPQTTHHHYGTMHDHDMSHVHDGPNHVHDGPSHTHTGPSHTHGPGTLQWQVGSMASYGSLRLYNQSGSLITLHTASNNKLGTSSTYSYNVGVNTSISSTQYFYTRVTGASGVTGSGGNNSTGSGGTGSTGAGGTGATSGASATITSSSGDGQTSDNYDPLYQDVIACIKD